MSNFIYHPYHLVNDSPWPIISALNAFSITSGLISWFHLQQSFLFMISFLVMVSTTFQWWRDVNRESSFQGLHSLEVQLGLRWGMILFITSEIFFFFSFFWTFFHSSLSTDSSIGGSWPPLGILPFNPLEIPLLNTMVLLSSGVSITWAHHAILGNNHTQAISGMMLTITQGVYFSFLQGMEYYEASFTFSDSIYGSTFFITTGFHGIHVLVGTTFLMVTTLRLILGKFSINHHFGFEASAWYWHFVDVVWLFLFISIYWWGNLFKHSMRHTLFLQKSNEFSVYSCFMGIWLLITSILDN